MGYLHGLVDGRVYYNKSLLDAAIDGYIELSKKYYAMRNSIDNAPIDVREERKKELKEIERQLEHQRMTAEVMASVQAGIDKYRQVGRKIGKEASEGPRSEAKIKVQALLDEGHHKEDLKILENYMIASGKPRPDSKHTAHHIVPGTGKTKEANDTRVLVHLAGIRINDPDNGVWLPTYSKYAPLWSMPASKGHLQYHTHGYEKWVHRELLGVRGESAIRIKLNTIGLKLQDNNIPPEAEPKVKASRK